MLALMPLGGCSRPVNSLDGVKPATVRITAEGTMAEPQENGEVAVSAEQASGTGFLISSDGFILTNYHVAMNAPTLKVYLNGEDGPRSASFVGGSQCSDIAVLKIEGRDFPYLELDQRQPIKEGDSLFLAGYPRGTETYTLKPGAVSTLRSKVVLPSAVVNDAFEHSADSQPGNSGSPVVRPNGKVVGIHFAGSREYKQPFAISSRLAGKLLPALRKGKDDSMGIGINGAYAGNIRGLLVNSVRAGSPASLSGVQPGDLITGMQAIAIRKENPVGQFCDTISSRGSDQPLMLELYRRSDQQILAGPVGTGLALKPKTSFTSFTLFGLNLLVPTTWNLGERESVHQGGASYLRRIATPDLGAFLNSYLASGAEMRLSKASQGINKSQIAEINRICATDAAQGNAQDGKVSTAFWGECKGKGPILLAYADSSAEAEAVIGLLLQLGADLDGTERQVMLQSLRFP